MTRLLRSRTVMTGLAIFSMLFGAGNLLYPLKVGIESGEHIWVGIAGFFITAICLPFLGLLAMILFNGDYEEFFMRLGRIPGTITTVLLLMILGPIIAIPRITTLSHVMISPFLPTFLQVATPMSSLLFALIFLGITFLCCYKENSIMEVLGSYISPLLLISLGIIVVKGLLTSTMLSTPAYTDHQLFMMNMVRGYETLDLLGTIFFSSMVLNTLKNTLARDIRVSAATLLRIGLLGGLFGVSLLGIVYVGMTFLGAYHGHGMETLNAGELFREVSFSVLGCQGALIIAAAVLLACLSTSIALSAVVAEFVQFKVFHNRIGYVPSLIIVLLLCLPLSVAGLGAVLTLTAGPLTYVGYPTLIALTMMNILYKLFGIRMVKIPVAATFIVSLISYLYR